METTLEKQIDTIKNLRFVIPIFSKGAPRESVMIEGELRFIRNEKRENYGKITIYTDSMYQPLYDLGALTFEEAKEHVLKNGGIFVKEDFDCLSISDLREIKGSLSEEWIKGFNDWINSDC